MHSFSFVSKVRVQFTDPQGISGPPLFDTPMFEFGSGFFLEMILGLTSVKRVGEGTASR